MSSKTILCLRALAAFALTVTGSTAQSAARAEPSGALTIATTGLTGDEVFTYSEIVDDTDLAGATEDEPDDEGVDIASVGATSRFSNGESGYGPSRPPLAVAGPFYLVSPDTIEMIGTVDSRSPRQFAQLMAQHPGVDRLVMVECPGSIDEDANHALARAVRRAGITTIVPAGGSVRSGAVDLFLAGVRREAAPSAEFGVHSWRDEDGMEADDFAANDPVNADYIAYYQEMGLSPTAARAFYALTNSVPFDDVRTLSAYDMARMGLADVRG